MPDVTAALLDQIVRTIVDEVDPEQVVLFGSRARGDARPDSDVDLLVVESEPFGTSRSRHAEIVRLGRALRQPQSPRTFSSTAATKWSGGATRETT